MRAIRVTASEFQQDFSALSDKAAEEPVIITRQGQDALVVVSVEEWARLSERHRTVGAAGDLSDEWLEAVLKSEMPVDLAHLDRELD